jgi:hypothetical protein
MELEWNVSAKCDIQDNHDLLPGKIRYALRRLTGPRIWIPQWRAQCCANISQWTNISWRSSQWSHLDNTDRTFLNASYWHNRGDHGIGQNREPGWKSLSVFSFLRYFGIWRLKFPQISSDIQFHIFHRCKVQFVEKTDLHTDKQFAPKKGNDTGTVTNSRLIFFTPFISVPSHFDNPHKTQPRITMYLWSTTSCSDSCLSMNENALLVPNFPLFRDNIRFAAMFLPILTVEVSPHHNRDCFGHCRPSDWQFISKESRPFRSFLPSSISHPSVSFPGACLGIGKNCSDDYSSSKTSNEPAQWSVPSYRHNSECDMRIPSSWRLFRSWWRWTYCFSPRISDYIRVPGYLPPSFCGRNWSDLRIPPVITHTYRHNSTKSFSSSSHSSLQEKWTGRFDILSASDHPVEVSWNCRTIELVMKQSTQRWKGSSSHIPRFRSSWKAHNKLFDWLLLKNTHIETKRSNEGVTQGNLSIKVVHCNHLVAS